MRWLNEFFKDIIILLKCQKGCGGNDSESAPTYNQSTQSKELQDLLYGKSTALTNLSYEDILKRFTPAGTAPQLAETALQKYSDLLNTQDYTKTDYSKTEQNYLDTLLRKYGESRQEEWKPIKERLIGEGLYESGPGFQQEREYGTDTSTGVSDITKQWAYEGIARDIAQTQYYDALKRGDYQTAYNLALQQNTYQTGVAQAASNYQLNALTPASTLFGQISQNDLTEYQARMNAYNSEKANQSTGNWGGLGTALGLGAAIAMPGALTLPAALAGMGIGGGLGSMFQY